MFAFKISNVFAALCILGMAIAHPALDERHNNGATATTVVTSTAEATTYGGCSPTIMYLPGPTTTIYSSAITSWLPHPSTVTSYFPQPVPTTRVFSTVIGGTTTRWTSVVGGTGTHPVATTSVSASQASCYWVCGDFPGASATVGLSTVTASSAFISGPVQTTAVATATTFTT